MLSVPRRTTCLQADDKDIRELCRASRPPPEAAPGSDEILLPNGAPPPENAEAAAAALPVPGALDGSAPERGEALLLSASAPSSRTAGIVMFGGEVKLIIDSFSSWQLSSSRAADDLHS